MDQLTIEMVEQPQATIVRLIGRIGVAEAPQLDRACMRLSAAKPPVVIFDLSRLELISSLGMGSLVAFHRGGKAHHERMVLAGAHGNLLDALRRVRLNELFEFAPSVEAALGQAP